MALQSSGNPISFDQIRTEFGENDTKSMGEYRVSQTVGALSNQPLDTGIPQSGAIKFSDFYDKRLNVIIDYHTSDANNPADAKSKYAQANDGTTGESEGSWTVIGGFRNPPTLTGGTKTRIHVNKTIGSSKGNATHCAVRTGTGWETGTVLTVEVGSSGLISGAGGDGGAGGDSGESEEEVAENTGGNGGAGTSGLGIQYEGTSIINNGSIVAGGGGGGGGGYRRLEREEWFEGPKYRANGGGGGGGQGIPNGVGGSVGSATGTTTFVSDGISNDDDTTYTNATSGPGGINNGVYKVMGSVVTVDSFQNTTDSRRTPGTYTNVFTGPSGNGSGATFNIIVNGNGKVTSITVNNSGQGYVVNNTITVNNSQLGNGADENGNPAANFLFDVASISDQFTFKIGGVDVGANLDGNPLIVGSGVGSKRYLRVPKDNSSENVTGGQPDPQVDNSPVNQVWRVQEFTLQNTNPGGGAGGNGSNTAGGAGGNGGENNLAHGGGGGGGGNAASGGEGGNNNDGNNGTSSKGGNGAQGVHTGTPENEENVTGEGGTGGSSGAAIRRTSGITVNITNNGTITGSQTATGVTHA